MASIHTRLSGACRVQCLTESPDHWYDSWSCSTVENWSEPKCVCWASLPSANASGLISVGYLPTWQIASKFEVKSRLMPHLLHAGLALTSKKQKGL